MDCYERLKNLSLKKIRHAQLSWWIIERKISYYHPDKLHPLYLKKLTSTDEEFDKLTIEYLNLCLDLELPNTVCHSFGGIEKEKIDLIYGEGMMEVDFSKPTVKQVLIKYGINSI